MPNIEPNGEVAIEVFAGVFLQFLLQRAELIRRGFGFRPQIAHAHLAGAQRCR